MATSSYAKSLLSGLQADLKVAMGRALEYVFDRNFSFGPIEHQGPTDNFRGIYVTSTTAAVANQEFSVAHGLGRTPNMAFPVINPRAVNSQLVAVSVPRAADASRLYFASASTGAVVFFYVE